MPILDAFSNIILIGMPGAGKSTIGVLLAKELALTFIDTDLLIQTRYGKKPGKIIKSIGMDGFRNIEEQVILSINGSNQLIATGGSAVYSEKAMLYLRKSGIVVFLDISLRWLKRRLRNLDQRGVIRAPGQTIDMLNVERRPLYLRHADLHIQCDKLKPRHVVAEIVTRIKGYQKTNEKWDEVLP